MRKCEVCGAKAGSNSACHMCRMANTRFPIEFKRTMISRDASRVEVTGEVIVRLENPTKCEKCEDCGLCRRNAKVPLVPEAELDLQAYKEPEHALARMINLHLARLSEDERMDFLTEAFEGYCTICGKKLDWGYCTCWRDD